MSVLMLTLQIALFSLSETFECAICQPEKYWCMVLSWTGPIFLEFAAMEYQPLLILAMF